MIEGVFDDSIFDEAAFQVDEASAFESERTTIEQAFSADHGPLPLLPHELAQRRKLWVLRLKNWRQERKEKRRRRDWEALALYALTTHGAVRM